MNMSKREFWKTMEAKEIKNWVQAGGAAAFAVAVFSIIAGVISKNLLTVGVGIVYLLLAAGILCLRSRFCAIAATFIYCADKLAGAFLMFRNGDMSTLATLSGIVVFLPVLWAGINGTMQFQKDWKQYRAGTYTRVPIPETRTLSQIANTQTLDDEEQ